MSEDIFEKTNGTSQISADGAPSGKESESKRLWAEFDSTYPQFYYTNFMIKRTCIISAIVTLIVGIIVFSIVFTNLPCAKEIAAWQEGTPEPESAVRNAVIAIVVGVILIIAAVVASVFISRAVAKKVQAITYTKRKTDAFEAFKYKKQQERVEAEKRAARLAAEEEKRNKLKEIFTCEFCGGEIECKTDRGTLETRGYVQDAYNVKVTGYNTAEVTPTYHTIEYKEYAGGRIVCRCRKCEYEIMKRERSDHRGYDRSFPVTVELYGKCKLTQWQVKNTKVYRYVDDYVIDIKP